MPRIGIVICVALALGACGGPSTPEFGRADADNIRKLAQDFASAYNAKDAAKVTTFFAGNATHMPPNSSPIRGHESISSYFENRFAEGATDLALEHRDIAGHGPLAYASGSYSLRLVPPQGGRGRRDRGKYVWILRNMAGNWRLEYTIFSSDLPVPSETSEGR